MSLLDNSTNDCDSLESFLLISYNSIIYKIYVVLNSYLEENKYLKNYKEKIEKQKKLVFYSSEIPTISIIDYLYRIQSLTNIEDSTLIISLIYIDKICEKASIILTEYNIHRLLFSSILVAIKYNEDSHYGHKIYAKIGGIPAKELKKLENEFLRLIQFDLYINKNSFEKYIQYFKKVNELSKKLNNKNKEIL